MSLKSGQAVQVLLQLSNMNLLRDCPWNWFFLQFYVFLTGHHHTMNWHEHTAQEKVMNILMLKERLMNKVMKKFYNREETVSLN